RVRDGSRLLVNLLEHEVAVLSLLRRIGRQLALADRALDGVTVAIDDLNRRAANLGDIAFFEEHEPPRHGQQRRDIGGDEVLLYAEPYDDRATLAGEDDAVRIAFAHDGKRISAFEIGYGRAHRLEQIAYAFEMLMDSMGDHLGVRLGGELVAAPRELCPQLLMILDDAVVNDREPVARDVRVRIALARHTVGRPARVRDAELAMRRIPVERMLQRLHLAHRAQPLQALTSVDYRNPGGVVAAILEPAQTLHQNGYDVALCDCSDDSTHAVRSSAGRHTIVARTALL